MSGWIKLHRSMTKWGWFTDVNTAHLFIYLLLKANHKDGHFKGIFVRRGELVVGRKKLSENTGLTEQQVRTSLKRLKSTNEIAIKSTNRFSIITILNYRKYQSDFELQQPADQPAGQPATNQQVTNKQPATNHKQEGKKLRNTNIPPYSPPLNPSFDLDSSGVGGGLVFPTSPAGSSRAAKPPSPEQDADRPRRTDSPSKSSPQWQAFCSCWNIYPRRDGREPAWCEWMRLHENRTLEASHVIRDSIQLHAAENYHWRDTAFAPRMDKWLRDKGWDDEPTPAPDAPEHQPRKTAYQMAQDEAAESYRANVDDEETKRILAELDELERNRKEAS